MRTSMESHSYTNTATMPSGEYGGDPQDVVGRHLGKEYGIEGQSGYVVSNAVGVCAMSMMRQLE